MSDIDTHRSIRTVEENMQKSFSNVRYDIQTINSWIFDLYKNHSLFPQKFDEASHRIIGSLESELNKLKNILEDFTLITSQQLKRIENLESIYDDMTSKMRGVEYSANKVETALESIDSNKLNRLAVIEDRLERILERLDAPKEEKKITAVYSSGVKGSKFHTKDCLSYKRLKDPKSFDTYSEARKAGLKVCRLCMPTEK